MKNGTDFELVLLPGSCFPGGKYSELYEQVYDTWKRIWLEIFTDVGSPEAMNPEGFFRADLIPVILHDRKIAAFYVATIYSLQPSWLRDHSYFSIYSKTTSDKLLARGVRNVMSYEFMTVLPEWRKSLSGFSLAGMLGELGQHIRDELGCDAAVGVARLQTKVDQIAQDVGAFTLEKNVRRGNLVCEIVACMKDSDRPHPDPQVHAAAEHLWHNRVVVDKYGNPDHTRPLQIAS
ncbi:hypothetical protein BH10BDE1_BH10BDE1_13530 [soil metagenome]